jgi:hypothetical protein
MGVHRSRRHFRGMHTHRTYVTHGSGSNPTPPVPGSSVSPFTDLLGRKTWQTSWITSFSGRPSSRSRIIPDETDLLTVRINSLGYTIEMASSKWGFDYTVSPSFDGQTGVKHPTAHPDEPRSSSPRIRRALPWKSNDFGPQTVDQTLLALPIEPAMGQRHGIQSDTDSRCSRAVDT